MEALRLLLNRKGVSAEVEGALKMVVGLGNPGPEYAATRHNVGFQVLDLLAERHRLSFDKFQKRARVTLSRLTVAEGVFQRTLLVKPMTFMNLSGEAVAALAQFYKVAPVDILVVCDDLDLPAGRLRLRASGGSGGQKGVQSTIQRLGTDGFPRLRVGIGRPPGQMDPSAYVLLPFSSQQAPDAAIARERAADAIEVWLARGIEAAMNQFNPAA